MTSILDEKKESLGSPGEITDPTVGRGGANHRRGADKSGGEKNPVM